MLRKLFFLLAIFIFLYILFLSPKVVATTPVNSSNAVDVKSAITVKFSVPVSRRALEKTISPQAQGEWNFENPVYRPNLLRKEPFNPDAALNRIPNKTLKLPNIKN